MTTSSPFPPDYLPARMLPGDGTALVRGYDAHVRINHLYELVTALQAQVDSDSADLDVVYDVVLDQALEAEPEEGDEIHAAYAPARIILSIDFGAARRVTWSDGTVDERVAY